MATAKPYHISGFALVAYPNRDSTGYKERYNIPEAQTIIRYTCQIRCLVAIQVTDMYPEVL